MKIQPTLSPSALAEWIVRDLELGILAVGLKGELLLWNRRMEERFPELAGARGRALFDALPALAQPSGTVDWKRVVLTHVLEEGRTVDVRGQEIGGHPYDVKVFPIRSGRQVAGAAIAMEDVTEKVREQRDLLRDERAASQANLGASVAHEIRNPLNSLALNIQLLKEDLVKTGQAGERSLGAIDTALKEIARMDRIIREFLQYARPPRIALRLEDVNETILGAMRLLEGQIRSAGVDVTVRLEPLPKILIDPDRLSEAIYNVLLNAVQAMSTSERKILQVGSGVEDGQVVIRIRDSGPGIPPEQRTRIFDLFFSTKAAGTGLGLPYVERVLTAHHGRVELLSEPGQGALFALYLPTRIIVEEGHGDDPARRG